MVAGLPWVMAAGRLEVMPPGRLGVMAPGRLGVMAAVHPEVTAAGIADGEQQGRAPTLTVRPASSPDPGPPGHRPELIGAQLERPEATQSWIAEA